MASNVPTLQEVSETALLRAVNLKTVLAIISHARQRPVAWYGITKGCERFIIQTFDALLDREGPEALREALDDPDLFESLLAEASERQLRIKALRTPGRVLELRASTELLGSIPGSSGDGSAGGSFSIPNNSPATARITAQLAVSAAATGSGHAAAANGSATAADGSTVAGAQVAACDASGNAADASQSHAEQAAGTVKVPLPQSPAGVRRPSQRPATLPPASKKSPVKVTPLDEQLAEKLEVRLQSIASFDNADYVTRDASGGSTSSAVGAQQSLSEPGTPIKAQLAQPSDAGPPATYIYSSLVAGVLWPGDVNPAERQQHLSDSDFEAVFGMQKDVYSKLPLWKRIRLKKEAQLF